MNYQLFALLAQAADPAKPSPLFQMMPLILIFVIFYFLLLRPQQKRAKEHEAMVAALKPGDEVITNGGIFGKITRVGEDAITVEIAEKVRIRVTPASVSRKVDEGEAK